MLVFIMFSNNLLWSEPYLSNHTSEYCTMGTTKAHTELNINENVLAGLSSIINEKKSSFTFADTVSAA